jgi:hypothetical protein
MDDKATHQPAPPPPAGRLLDHETPEHRRLREAYFRRMIAEWGQA